MLFSVGTFKAKETLMSCVNCPDKQIHSSEELGKLIPHRCQFGFDIIVYIGMAMFISCRGEEDIKRELRIHRNITISINEISYLAKKFIVYLAIAHEDSSRKLKHFLYLNGGYILHLDATCEGDSPHLMTGLDGTTGIILENIKLPSENADRIIPFLMQIKAKFGVPLALVHDMGKGVCSSVKSVFPDTHDYICHFHFLRDIGKDLFGKENDRLRTILGKHGIQGTLRKKARELRKTLEDTGCNLDEIIRSLKNGSDGGHPELVPILSLYSLVLWTLDGKNTGQGYGFPFDQPYLSFYTRINNLYLLLDEMRDDRRRKDPVRWFTSYMKLIKSLRSVAKDPKLPKIAARMEEKVIVFEQLRNAMRLAVPGCKKGLKDPGDQVKMETIQKRVTHFRDRIRKEKSYSSNTSYQKMVAQIEKYWEKLFADPLKIERNGKCITVYPQRTNNILEGLFRDFKRRHRKKSGNNSLTKTIKSMLPDTLLIKNLENPNYMKILLDGEESLEDRFSKISTGLVREKLEKEQSDDSKIIAPKFKKVIKEDNFLKYVSSFFRSN